MESFWDFSGETYRKPGVAEACLTLQDRHGLDVNILLFCCWYGCTRGAIDQATWNRVLSFSEPWGENVVRPLRAARTWMKNTGRTEPAVSGEECMELRESIKEIELEAERLQENTLQALVQNTPPKILDITSIIICTTLNILDYFRCLNVDLDEESRSDLTQIVTAAISGASSDVVADALSGVLPEI